MGSPALHESVFAIDSVTETFSNAPAEFHGEWGARPSLSARAVFAVSGLGAGFWYVLWKIALHFVARR